MTQGLHQFLEKPSDLSALEKRKLLVTIPRVLQQPEIREQLAKLQMEILSEDPDTAAKNLATIARLYTDIARRIGIKQQ